MIYFLSFLKHVACLKVAQTFNDCTQFNVFPHVQFVAMLVGFVGIQAVLQIPNELIYFQFCFKHQGCTSQWLFHIFNDFNILGLVDSGKLASTATALWALGPQGPGPAAPLAHRPRAHRSRAASGRNIRKSRMACF